MVEVTEEEVKNSVKLIPSWTTVVRGGGAFLSWGGCGHCLRLALCWTLCLGGCLGSQPQCQATEGGPLFCWRLDQESE